MNFMAILSISIFLFLGAVVAEKFHKQHNPNLRPRRVRECPDGFGGTNCKDNVDECNGIPYPCSGGIRHGSFCVDYDPPQKFKCGCKAGYDAILPNAVQVEDPVPVEWRPLECSRKNACVDFFCHEDATCVLSFLGTAECVCNDNLIGDGISNCSPPPKKTSPSEMLRGFCVDDSNCNNLENSVCVDGVCKCNAGFYQINGKGKCRNENECADGFPNNCHKHANCTDTEGSYTCICRDGYQDLSPKDEPGRNCSQVNECLDPSTTNCDSYTQVCVDLPPPAKWKCEERLSPPLDPPPIVTSIPGGIIPSSMPTDSPAPTPSPSMLPSRTPSKTPSAGMILPSSMPTDSPQPTPSPSMPPSRTPSKTPSAGMILPSSMPTDSPQPTPSPSMPPSRTPSKTPASLPQG